MSHVFKSEDPRGMNELTLWLFLWFSILPIMLTSLNGFHNFFFWKDAWMLICMICLSSTKYIENQYAETKSAIILPPSLSFTIFTINCSNDVYINTMIYVWCHNRQTRFWIKKNTNWWVFGNFVLYCKHLKHKEIKLSRAFDKRKRHIVELSIKNAIAHMRRRKD